MARPKHDKLYVLNERKLIIFERLSKGFSQSDVARMLNVHKSVITTIMKQSMEEYKMWTLLNK